MTRYFYKSLAFKNRKPRNWKGPRREGSAWDAWCARWDNVCNQDAKKTLRDGIWSRKLLTWAYEWKRSRARDLAANRPAVRRKLAGWSKALSVMLGASQSVFSKHLQYQSPWWHWAHNHVYQFNRRERRLNANQHP